MTPPPPGTQIDLASPNQVCQAFERGAQANREAHCRALSIDRISQPGQLIATGDLHDNPAHFETVVRVANLTSENPCHLTLHELIHSDRLINGMDFSYRALAKAAALKAEHPEHVHTLLANHELAQIIGAGIIKDGIRVVEAFNQGVEYAFGSESGCVTEAINTFVRSMPLALRCECAGGDILCAHSVPGPAMMARFDPGILERDLTEDDYAPRRGSAHLMVWGRDYDAEQLEDLVERWGVHLFVLGHEKAEMGIRPVQPCALVLNSDHAQGVYLPIDLSALPTFEQAAHSVVALATA